MPRNTNTNTFRSLWRRLIFATTLFTISVYLVLGAFTSAAYVRVPHQQNTYFIHDTMIVPITVAGTIVSVLGLAYLGLRHSRSCPYHYRRS
jgi:Ni,Fe-hydrogenase I cytochrome b subunit